MYGKSYHLDSLREQQEKLQAERLALIRENRKAQEKLDRFDKLLDDFVQVSVVGKRVVLVMVFIVV